MKKTLLFSSLLLASHLAFAGASEDVKISDPYVRAVPPGQPNSAAFMLLENSAATAHSITSANSDVAETVELHTHVMEDGMMKMRPIPEITLAAGEKTELKPGGLHVMLIGLKQDLTPDSNVTITLNFADGSSTELTAPVRKIETMPMDAEHGRHQH